MVSGLKEPCERERRTDMSTLFCLWKDMVFGRSYWSRQSRVNLATRSEKLRRTRHARAFGR